MLFLGPVWRKPNLLGAFDLGHAPVMDNELNDTVAEVPHVCAHEGKPLRLASNSTGIAGSVDMGMAG